MDRLTLNNSALDRTLGIFAETDTLSAQRASVALSGLLAPVQQSMWPEVNYSFSRLTGDGFPVEFTFSSGVDAISYTTEIAGPETMEGLKVNQACVLLSERTSAPGRNVIELTNRLARQPALQYGAWMGGRHGQHTEDRYKIYLEITEACQDIGKAFWQPFLSDASMLNAHQYKLRMISIDNKNKLEYYFRLFNMDVWELHNILGYLDFREQGKELISFINLVSKRRIDKSFIGNNLGLSITLDTQGLPQAVSIFTFNYKVFEPGDRFIRERILACSNRFGWNFSNYARITESIAAKISRLTHHGLIAFSITREGTKVMQVGLRPPEGKNNQ